jgi:hypothetical protein
MLMKFPPRTPSKVLVKMAKMPSGPSNTKGLHFNLKAAGAIPLRILLLGGELITTRRKSQFNMAI